MRLNTVVFSRAVGADQADELILADRQVNGVDRREPAKPDGRLVEPQERLG